MAKIDLRAPIISGDTRVWRLFPGGSYKFLSTFKADQVAFLDVPGFEMPDVKLSEANDLPTRIRRTEVMMEKLSREGREAIPRITEDDLQNFRVGKKRQRNQQAIINFYEVAKTGDLVVVPDQLSIGRVMIGVFAQQRAKLPHVTVPNIYGPVPVPARPINWLANVPENKVSTPLSSSLRHQHPFNLLEKSLFLEVFSLAFSSYVYNDHYSATIFNTKDDYLDRETSLIGLVSTLSATFCEKVSKGEENHFDLLDAIFEQASIEFHCSQAADIHSEGFNRFTSAKATPLVIAAFFAALSFLATADSQQQMEKMVDHIEFVNTFATEHDECTALVSKTTNLMLKSMNGDKLWKKCQSMKDAEQRAGLTSSAKIVKE